LSRHLALDEQRVSTSLVVYIICRLAISACINGLNLEASSSSESLLLPLSSLNPVGEQQFCFCTSAANECVVCLFVYFLFRIFVFLVLASQDFAGS
jgi:flagellar biosynthesis protein FlhB